MKRMIGWAALMPLLLAACAPAYVDTVSRLPQPKLGALASAAQPVPRGSVIPAEPKPGDPVRPRVTPDPASSFAPEPPIALPSSQPRTPPPPTQVWQPPPPGYGAYRTSPIPLGIPNRPPAAWRY